MPASRQNLRTPTSPSTSASKRSPGKSHGPLASTARRKPPGRRQPPELPPSSSSSNASDRNSTSSAPSQASYTASDASFFWGRLPKHRRVSIESHSSYEDEIYLHHRGRPSTRVPRPSVSSTFSFPSPPPKLPSPATSSEDASQAAFLRSLGLANRNGPVIVLMRHCQSESNGGATRGGVPIPEEQAYQLRDPPLSDQGKIQASKLKYRYPQIIENVKRAGGKVLISHLLRAKQTAFFGFPEFLNSHRNLVEIRPELQEMFETLCDTGKAAEDQEAEFPGFDYSRCTPDVNAKKGIYAPKARSICANAILKELRSRPEPILFLVTHGHTIIELLQNRHWKEGERYIEYQGNGKATVFAFHDHTTKLRPVSKKYAAKILGRPAIDSK